MSIKYVNNSEEVIDNIFNYLLFRKFIEVFRTMLSIKLINEEENEYDEINNFIEIFNEYNANPEECFELKLNKLYEIETKEMIINMVNKFIDDYIFEEQFNICFN